MSAYSGEYIIGNDLGGGNRNGTYQSEKTNWAMSPEIEVGDRTNVHLQYRRWLTVEDGAFDQATIFSNDIEVWKNLDSQQGALSDFHHTDKEWRFHDVDLSSTIVDGKVRIRYQLSSDSGNNFGGWNIDDFCVVAYIGDGVCGNGIVEKGETCDDGNTVEDDKCPNSCRKSGGCNAGGEGQSPLAFALG